jgi:glutamate/tyrosine decarboxylase-like PLP-dependent enzyme
MGSPFAPPLRAAFELASEFLDQLSTTPVAARATMAELRGRLRRPLADAGVPAEQVVRELSADAAGGLTANAGGRFFGWVMGGALPASLGADWLASTWDQNASVYACSPAAAIVEEVAGAWLLELLQLPATASFAMVTGCQMAHTTCLAAARHWLLAERGWDVEERGLAGCAPIRIFTSTERHGSFDRAVRLVGLGRACITPLTTDGQGRLEPEALAAALAEDADAPTIVLLQAGDLHMGTYDDFSALIPVARRANAWVHVDGAFGLWAAASPRYAHLMKGAAEADSWATDGHKWLNVPYDCGYAFVARPEAHRAAMTHRAAYFSHSGGEARDQMDWNPEWSRRARGFATYAAIRELGRDGVAALIERCCRHAEALVNGIGALPYAQVVWPAQINQGLVRFFDDDARTAKVIAAVQTGGGAFLGGSTFRGQHVMRISVCNWMTSGQDVETTIAAVRNAIMSV